MEEAMYQKHIQPMINYFRMEAKYISNRKILDYLRQNTLLEHPETIEATLDYYSNVRFFPICSEKPA